MKARHFKSRHALLMSLTSLMLCVSMLFGATFAWFTDSVTSGVNRIVSGNLDVELYHVNSGTASDASEDSKKVDNQTQLFRASIEGNKKLWEPGAMAYETFTVKNVGSLALKYQMAFNKVGNNFVMEKDSNGNYQNTGRSLLDVLRVGVIDGALAGDANRSTVAGQVTAWTTLKDFGNVFTADQNLAPGVDGEPFTVVLYWPSDTENVSALAGGTLKDNDYNLQNGKYASDASAATVGELYVDLGITLLATQDTVEADSFDNQYDASSTQPSDGWSGVYQVSQTVSGSNTTNEATTITIGNNGANATIPNAVAKTETSEIDNDVTTTTTTTTTYELTVEPTTEPANFLVDISSDVSAAHYEIDLSQYTTTTTQVGDATPESTDSEKTAYSGGEVIKVELKIGQVELKGFYHNGNTMTKVTSTADEHYGEDQTYMYDVQSGTLTLWTSTFSPFSATYKFAGGLGTEAAPYLIANREQMQAISEEENYAYYKWNGASTVDCTNWTPIFLYGSFDGAGVKFENLDQPLFRYVYANDENNERDATVENFDIVDCNVISSSYYVAPVIHIVDVSKTVTLSNIDISGYAEAIIVSSFVGQSFAGTLNINDCKSTLTLVATGGQVSGFVGNGITLEDWGAKYNPIYVKVTDSVYHGSMAGTGESGRYVHAHNNSNCKLSLTYTEAFLSSYNDGDLYPSFAETNASSANPISAGLSYGVAYKKLVKKTLTAPSEVGETITFTKDADAVTAVAGMVIGLNPGNGTGVYQKDTIDLNSVEVGANVSTTTVKKYNIAINNDGHSGTGAEGDTQYISSSYCNGTYNSYFAYVIQYDMNGAITSVSTCDLK